MAWLKTLLLAASLILPASAWGSQGSGCMPTSGTVSGLTLVQNINAANAAFISMNSGSTAPVTDCTGLSILGQLWLDTNTNTVKTYDGSNWLSLGQIDAVNHVWTPRIGGGSGALTAGTSVNLGSIPQGLVIISGGTTIASFGSSAEIGTIKFLKFTGTPTITNSGSLILPTGADISVTSGDQAVAVYLGGNVWSVFAYTRADGTALSTSSNFIGSVFLNAAITPTAIAANTNDWSPTGLSSANVIRASASAAYNVTGLVAPATNGKLLTIENVGSFNITLTTDTSSTAANRFAFASPFVLRPGGSVTIIYDATAARWKFFNEPAPQTIAGGYKNLSIVNDSGAPTTTMRITADQLTVEDTYGRARRLSNVSVAPVMTASGANGLDTGSIVNNVITWYAEYVIYNPTTDTTAGLYSIASSCSGVTMPSGYTFCARVGWVRTDGAATARWMRIRQSGRYAQYQLVAASNTTVYPIASSSNNSLNTSVTISNFVPTTAFKIAGALAYSCSATTTCIASVNPNNQGSTNGNSSYVSFWNGGTSFNNNLPFEFALEGSAIFSGGSSTTAQSLFIRSWEDNL